VEQQPPQKPQQEDTHKAMAEGIAKRIIHQNQWLVGVLLVANGLVLVFIENNTVALAVGNLIGGSISSLWQERQQIIGYFFGSSLGSKMKDAKFNGGQL